MSLTRKLSGLQQDVLKLYRVLLRSAKAKDPDGARGLRVTVREQFREQSMSVSRNDFTMIEHLLRYGYKQKKLMERPGFAGAKSVQRTHPPSSSPSS